MLENEETKEGRTEGKKEKEDEEVEDAKDVKDEGRSRRKKRIELRRWRMLGKEGTKKGERGKEKEGS